MQFSAHGKYTIEQQDNILIVDAQGPFNDVITEQYKQEMKKVIKQINAPHWATAIIYHGNGVFTPEAEYSLIETTRYRMEKGMIAVAAVIAKDSYSNILHMQLQRIYHACNITFQAFNKQTAAVHWLKTLLDDDVNDVSNAHATHYKTTINKETTLADQQIILTS